MISKLINPDLTWKQYDVKKYLIRTSTFEKGKQKLLEALVLSEIDSDAIDNYSDNYKKSRSDRAKVISSSTPQDDSIKTIKQIDKSVSSSETKRQKPKITYEKILEPRISIPLPPVKRIRIDESGNGKDATIDARAFAAPSSLQNSKQKDFIKTKSPGSTSYLSTNDSHTEPPSVDDTSRDAIVLVTPGSLNDSKQTGLTTEDTATPSTSSENGQRSNNATSTLASSENDISVNDKISNAPKTKNVSNFGNSMASLEYRDRMSGVSYEELSLSKLNEIILILRSMKIQSQSSSGTINDSRSFFDSPKCPKLPIGTKKDVMSISKKLEDDKKLKIKLKNALGSIGGRDVNNVLANICSKLFSNKVATFYSWAGRKSKKSLEDTNFANLIIRSVKVSCPNEADHTIKLIGSKWFAQAKTRLTRELAKEGDDKDNDKDNGKEDGEDDGEDDGEEFEETEADDEEDA
ncbi:uncharacterized protein LOC127284019 isoform X2 [Leptopilina boulardi]|uniref:uncharacterized protein LOC127284019 isoform X2 n=1 Tax=Leptopilina boulardi TaxID=63433 RepID=UPI0021F5C43C|nr:uncharacterized protein LOC127284019 isoform X2 [Leptopilina boulardi]